MKASMHTLIGQPADASFGQLLRFWRTTRRMSQLTLAAEAGISPRHLSFLETGRAQPSREMAMLLAGVLDLSLPERSVLLVGAGYAPIFDEPTVANPESPHVRRYLEYALRQQEPYPALVVNAKFDIVMRNNASRRIFEFIRGPVPGDQPINTLRTMFHPQGLRPYVVNWEEKAECMLQSVQHHIAATGSAATIRLRDELLSYPQMPSRFRVVAPVPSRSSLVNLRLRKGNLSLAFFTAETFLGPRHDVALQDLRIECFFPADDSTERIARNLASTRAFAS